MNDARRWVTWMPPLSQPELENSPHPLQRPVKANVCLRSEQRSEAFRRNIQKACEPQQVNHQEQGMSLDQPVCRFCGRAESLDHYLPTPTGQNGKNFNLLRRSFPTTQQPRYLTPRSILPVVTMIKNELGALRFSNRPFEGMTGQGDSRHQGMSFRMAAADEVPSLTRRDCVGALAIARNRKPAEYYCVTVHMRAAPNPMAVL